MSDKERGAMTGQQKCATCGHDRDSHGINLTPAETTAIKALERLSKRWPSSLLIFANGNGLSIRKSPRGKFPSPDTEVAYIFRQRSR